MDCQSFGGTFSNIQIKFIYKLTSQKMVFKIVAKIHFYLSALINFYFPWNH